VALSGGVFMNALLSEEAEKNLAFHGFCPYRQRAVPANDGGISFGQLAVAMEQMAG
jgi:hydrogenase maturation protein HypF